MRCKLILAGVLCGLLLCGCEDAESSYTSQEEKPQKQTTSAYTQPVEVREYAFPEFLKTAPVGDMLSNVVSPGFDPASVVSYLELSPFKKYNCDRRMLDDYYTFYEDDFVGMVNSDGVLILAPDKYASAEPVAPDLIKLTPPDKGKDPVYFRMKNGFGEILSYEEAVKTEIIAPYSEDTTLKQYALSVRDNTVSQPYDSLDRADPASVVTGKEFSQVYKATAGSRTYYLVLDEYCNITICEAPYAQVRIKVGGEYGECYILDGDDHTELMKMIQSFGSDTISVKPGKDETLDFIQIESGIGSANRTVMTMSPDGFCFTETFAEGVPDNKYFALYPKDTFVDLVNWVSEVVSREYESDE